VEKEFLCPAMLGAMGMVPGRRRKERTMQTGEKKPRHPRTLADDAVARNFYRESPFCWVVHTG